MMLKPYFLCIFLLSFSSFSFANDQAVSVGYLNGFDDIQGVRVAWRPTTLDIDTTWLGDVDVYLEAGIGLSVVSDQHFAGKDIGSHYQFEDNLGLIIDLDESEKLTQQVAVRFIHYSNGGLNNDNPGLDFLNLAYIAHF